MGAERSWVTNVVGRLAYSVIRKQKIERREREKIIIHGRRERRRGWKKKRKRLTYPEDRYFPFNLAQACRIINTFFANQFNGHLKGTVRGGGGSAK